MIARGAILILLAASVPAVAAQQLPERSNFDRILAAGALEQIPWQVNISPPELNLDQRMEVRISVNLDGNQLNKHGSQHELLLLARAAPEGGVWAPGTTRLYQRLDEPLPRRTDLTFSMKLLVTPGSFRMGIVLLDRMSGHRSVTLRTFRVLPLIADPLPQLFAGLPAVEFVRIEEGVDTAIQFQAAGQARMVIDTVRPAELELLVNFGHSEEFSVPRLDLFPNRGPLTQGSRRRRGTPNVEKNLALILAALKPLAGLSVANGAARITGLDLVRRKVIFEQGLDGPLDWLRLRDALADMDSNVVDVKTLANQTESPAFFRDLLQQRLRAGASATPAEGSAATAPLRVFIVLSGATLFVRGAEVTAITPPEDCNCRVYYIRLFLLGNIWDELEEILKPLKPRRFDVRTPLDYRKALGAIVEELGKL